jgi:hypothetical protein
VKAPAPVVYCRDCGAEFGEEFPGPDPERCAGCWIKKTYGPASALRDRVLRGVLLQLNALPGWADRSFVLHEALGVVEARREPRLSPTDDDEKRKL